MLVCCGKMVKYCEEKKRKTALVLLLLRETEYAFIFEVFLTLPTLSKTLLQEGAFNEMKCSEHH